MQTIDLSQAKQHLPKLIEQTISGDEVIIAQGGQPLVKLVALTTENRDRYPFFFRENRYLSLFSLRLRFDIESEEIREKF